MKFNLIPSANQTKHWRMRRSWYKNGKHSECERYQRNLVERITESPCIRTNVRINSHTYEMRKLPHPLKSIDGFEWTEDFDGFQDLSGKMLFYNFKFICDKGGSQTRSLREVYHFVSAQIKHQKRYRPENLYFINILDGDCSHAYHDKFLYLKRKSRFSDRVFIGDMKEFYAYYMKMKGQ